MPTMAGAFALDLYKNYDKLAQDDMVTIAVGFIMAFIAGVIVVRSLLDFVSRHGICPPFALVAHRRRHGGADRVVAGGIEQCMARSNGSI